MLEQSIYFENSIPQYADFFNKLKERSSIRFPSNIINLSLTIKDYYVEHAYNKGVDNPIPIDVGGHDGKLSALGWGIEDVSYIGNQAFYAAWMKLLSWDGTSGANRSMPNPKNSYLQVLAIAECE
tara:strand:- start:7763 stop:8137 length:375 start_codon:yes stop_codon:yes gene_type:complete